MTSLFLGACECVLSFRKRACYPNQAELCDRAGSSLLLATAGHGPELLCCYTPATNCLQGSGGQRMPITTMERARICRSTRIPRLTPNHVAQERKGGRHPESRWSASPLRTPRRLIRPRFLLPNRCAAGRCAVV